jgi:hypothetical protein
MKGLSLSSERWKSAETLALDCPPLGRIGMHPPLTSDDPGIGPGIAARTS